MSDDCKGITVQKLKEIIKEKKKSNKNLRLSGSKAELCKQYLQHKTPSKPNTPKPNTPKPNTPKPNTPKPVNSPKTQLYELTKKVAQSLNRIDDLFTLKHKLNTIVEQQITELKKKKKYVTSNDLITMMKKSVNMDEIVKQLNKIDDEYTREDVGSEVLENATKLFFKYERSDQEKFLETVGRTTTEDWLIQTWDQEDEKIVVSMLRKKTPMNKVINFLEDKNKHDPYWSVSMISTINYNDLRKLYSVKDLQGLEKIMIID